MSKRVFHSPCRCGKFQPKAGVQFKWAERFQEAKGHRTIMLQERQYICRNCGRHEPSEAPNG